MLAVVVLLFARLLFAKVGAEQCELLRFIGSNPALFAVPESQPRLAAPRKSKIWCEELRLAIELNYDRNFGLGCGKGRREKMANGAWANIEAQANDSESRSEMSQESLAAHGLGKEKFVQEATAPNKAIQKAWKNKVSAVNLKKRKAAEADGDHEDNGLDANEGTDK